MSILKLLAFWPLLFAASPESTTMQPVNVCAIYGAVFEDTNPYRATYRIYLVEDEYDADLVVFKESNRLMADKTGLWFFTRNPNFAEFSVCFVDDPNLANFFVHFTDIDVEARCDP